MLPSLARWKRATTVAAANPLRGFGLAALAIAAAMGLNLRVWSNPPLANPPPGPDNAAIHAQNIFLAARARQESAPRDTEAAWQFARACFDRAEFATNHAERAAIAEQGIAAGRRTMARDSNSVPTHYYLGMNLGQLAQTKMLGALKIVSEMEREFKITRALDERYDFAGPDRNLGLLYSEAPAIASVGSRTKARHHLERAVELAPDYPENRLNLLEACLKWGDHPGAQRELNSLEALWPRAHTNFTGEAWATAWTDWEARLKKTRKQIEASSKRLDSPHDKN
jgi:tetratricopeptide (TPR) repeat protein